MVDDEDEKKTLAYCSMEWLIITHTHTNGGQHRIWQNIQKIINNKQYDGA